MSYGVKNGTVKEPFHVEFMLGGCASALSAFCTQPIDLLKVRLQLQGEQDAAARKLGLCRTAFNIAKQQGILGLYQGLSASLLRQVTYSATRLGSYPIIKNSLQGANEEFISLWKKLVAGMASGAIGAFVGTPADLTMVRMQADGRLPPELRRNYKNVFDGLYRIIKEEGVVNLWRGCSPTVVRAMLVTAGQVSCYDQIKQFLLSMPYFADDFVTHFTASLAAGFIATAATSPIDVVKTRIMNMKPTSSGSMPYSGILDCFYKTGKAEGLMGFYKGFVPNFARLGPQTVLTFLFYEQLAKLYQSLKRGGDAKVAPSQAQ